MSNVPSVSLLHSLIQSHQRERSEEPLADHIHKRLTVVENIKTSLTDIADAREDIRKEYNEKMQLTQQAEETIQRQCPHYDVDSISQHCRICNARST